MIPVNEPTFSVREKELLSRCIDTGWISSEGAYVQEFESRMAAWVGVKHGVTVCNGTVALELAVASLKLPPGSGVIVPTFTIIACVLALVRNGLRPVLVDADPGTWCLDIAAVHEKVYADPEIRAILPVHIFGHPCDMAPLLELAKQRGLAVIEDAAEAHGAWYRDSLCGGMGDVSIFSFYANKIVTTGEGGMVLTNDGTLAERARSLRNLAFQTQQRFLHTEAGYNFRMGNLQAAVGVAQMERIETLVNRKIRQGERYRRHLGDLKGITLQQIRPEAEPVYWVNGIVLDDTLPVDGPQLAAMLKEKGIGTRPFFWPMHEQPVFLNQGLFAGERYPVAEQLARRGLYLPSGMALTDDQIDRVCQTLRDCLATMERK